MCICIYIQAAASGGGGLGVRDALEVVLYAFARLGQRGQAEVLADEESPHMTILLSALSRLLLVHKGGVGDKDLKMACNSEAAEVLLTHTLTHTHTHTHTHTQPHTHTHTHTHR